MAQTRSRSKTLLFHDVGSAAVEMAVVLPLLLLLIIGVADYARLFVAGIAVANAAKAGAQYGAQSTTMSGDTAAMNQAARQDGLEVGSITATSARVCRCSDGAEVNCITGTCGSYGAPRVYVAVTASKTITTMFDYPGLPRTIPIRRTATLRIQ